MLKKLLKKKEPREKMRGLSQREAQVIAPPNIIERRPGEDDGQGGQATDYWVRDTSVIYLLNLRGAQHGLACLIRCLFRKAMKEMLMLV